MFKLGTIAAAIQNIGGAAAPIIQSSATISSSGGTQLTCNVPSGLQSNDLLILLVSGSSRTISNLQGWTQIGTPPANNFRAFWKISTGTTLGTAIDTSGTQAYDSLCLRITGHNASAPIDQLAWGTFDTASATTTNAPTITPTVSSSLLIAFFASTNTAGQTCTADNGLTAVASSHAQRSASAFQKTLSSAAATNATTGTFSAVNTGRAGLHFNIKP